MANEILVKLIDGIKTIAFNAPAKKNPLTLAMGRALHQALKDSETDGTRCIILTGVGANFSAGADLDPSAMADGRGADVTKYLKEEVNPIVQQLCTMGLPVIAKVRGVAVGVGMNLALACDIVMASENARFSQIFTKIGLSSDGGGSYFMLEKLGYHKAYELMATAAMLSAEEAHTLGLVNHVVADAALDDAVHEMATRLANGPLVALKATKRNLLAARTGGLVAALNAEAENQADNFKASDFMEGVMAFLQKRPAKFTGK